VDNFEFTIGVNDTIFVLTRNNSKFKDGIINITSKMIIINESKYIELLEFSKILGGFNINKLNIININNECKPNTINIIRTNEESLIMYIEMNYETFMYFINIHDNFMKYNKNTLYILRNGYFIGIKNIFASIGSCRTSIHSFIYLLRGGYLTTFMLAMLNKLEISELESEIMTCKVTVIPI
jgi:hypothetical protein